MQGGTEYGQRAAMPMSNMGGGGGGNYAPPVQPRTADPDALLRERQKREYEEA